MIEVAYAIQADLRREACWQRLANRVPRRKTMHFGRYRVTVTRDPSPRLGTN
jgi:hypothetical protein